MRLRRSNYKHYLHSVASIVYSLIILCAEIHRASGVSDKCDTCKEIVEKFNEGLKKTKKSGFGGGNTNWEEGSLGSWINSETRLVEIMDTLCGSDKCHMMLEQHEETIERFWFEQFGKNTGADMEQWLCVDNVKVCCLKNMYGPKCAPCPGGDRICSDNGDCDGGGTREGTGKCNCHMGYKGDNCFECIEGFYAQEQNETHTTCRSCHRSCESNCKQGGPEGCDECGSGWTMGDNGCIDFDECEAGTSHCGSGEFCDNSDGSYQCGLCNPACDECSGPGDEKCRACKENYIMLNNECKACDASCDGCTGLGPEKCVACKEGYTLVDGSCKDVDECSVDPNKCEKQKFCLNFPGSFKCEVCDESCDGCTGTGPENCNACYLGFNLVEEKCEDIDECNNNPCHSKGEHLTCDNIPGSFTCVCVEGYKMDTKFKCVKKSKEKPKSKKSKGSTSKSKNTTQKKKKKKSGIMKPSMAALGIVILCFICIGNIASGASVVVVPTSVFTWIYVYWFASQFDKL